MKLQDKCTFHSLPVKGRAAHLQKVLPRGAWDIVILSFSDKLNCKLFLFKIIYEWFECYLTSIMLWSSVIYCLERRFLWLLFIFFISVWQVTNEILFLKLNPASFLSSTHKGWIIICFLDRSCALSSPITL